MEKQHFLININMCLWGSVRVGKSSFCKTVRSEKSLKGSDPYVATVGMEYCSTFVEVEDIRFKFIIWELCGAPRYRKVLTGYLKRPAVLLVFYDITDDSTFKEVKYFIEEARRCAINAPLVVLVGNKLDRSGERKVEIEDGENFAEEMKLNIFREISVWDVSHVNDLLDDVASMLLNSIPESFDRKLMNGKEGFVFSGVPYTRPTKRLRKEMGEESERIEYFLEKFEPDVHFVNKNDKVVLKFWSVLLTNSRFVQIELIQRSVIGRDDDDEKDSKIMTIEIDDSDDMIQEIDPSILLRIILNLDVEIPTYLLISFFHLFHLLKLNRYKIYILQKLLQLKDLKICHSLFRQSCELYERKGNNMHQVFFQTSELEEKKKKNKEEEEEDEYFTTTRNLLFCSPLSSLLFGIFLREKKDVSKLKALESISNYILVHAPDPLQFSSTQILCHHPDLNPLCPTFLKTIRLDKCRLCPGNTNLEFSKDAASFSVHVEILVLRTNFFLSMLRFGGEEMEELSEVGSVTLEFLEREEVMWLIDCFLYYDRNLCLEVEKKKKKKKKGKDENLPKMVVEMKKNQRLGLLLGMGEFASMFVETRLVEFLNSILEEMLENVSKEEMEMIFEIEIAEKNKKFLTENLSNEHNSFVTHLKNILQKKYNVELKKVIE